MCKNNKTIKYACVHMHIFVIICTGLYVQVCTMLLMYVYIPEATCKNRTLQCCPEELLSLVASRMQHRFIILISLSDYCQKHQHFMNSLNAISGIRKGTN